MKKLVLIVMVLMVSNIAFAQYSKWNNNRKKPVTFQVAPSAFSYNDNMVFGFHIGVNYKEALNVSYFAMRDYDFSDGIKDYGWYGLNAAYMLKLGDHLAIGPVLRLASINGEWEKPYYGAEMRYNLNRNWKIGFEYGSAKSEKGPHKGFGFKFIWNMY